MRLIPARAWAFILLSALLQIASFPIAGPLPPWRSAFCWIALVPFLLALLRPGRGGVPLSLLNAALLGYGCGIVFYAGDCYWIFQTMNIYGGIPQPLSFIILILFALYLGLYHALFATLVHLVFRSRFGVRGALIVAPFAWVAVELARGRITGFPWDLLGYSQVDNLFLTRLAPLAGVMAISFVIAAVGAALCFFFFAASRRGRLIPFAGVLLAGLFTTLRNSAAYTEVTTASHTAVLMQENLEVGAVGKEVQPLSVESELVLFSNATILHMVYNSATSAWQPAQRGSDRPDLAVWPEAPSHFQSNDPAFLDRVGELAHFLKAPVIAGSLGVDRDAAARKGYYLYDSASLFDSAGNYVSRYDKIHLVPWGEYTPYPAIFGFVHKLTEGIGDMDIGRARTVFVTSGHTYGTFVCYESIFGTEVREFAMNGAEVLVNISDDGWYGDSGAPWQHLNMARMRAIENHRWLLRDTNTGITTAIDPEGRMAAQAPRHVRAAFAFPFEFTQGTTFYTRHGDWFAWLCALVTLICLYPFLRTFRVKQFVRS